MGALVPFDVALHELRNHYGGYRPPPYSQFLSYRTRTRVGTVGTAQITPPLPIKERRPLWTAFLIGNELGEFLPSVQVDRAHWGNSA